MKYLKLRISAPPRGVVYEKDVDVGNAFDVFIRIIVDELVHNETVKEDDPYTAIVIPRYGKTLRWAPIVSGESQPQKAPERWIALRYDEQPPADEDPYIQFFTIELRFPSRLLLYIRDFQNLEIGQYYVSFGVAQALARLGVLKQGECYEPRFYARDDENGQLDREHFPELAEQAADLIELVDSGAPAEPAFPICDPRKYGAVNMIGELRSDSIKIFIRREAAEQLKREGLLSKTAERGGMLIGTVFEDPFGGRRIVEISDFLISEHTIASEKQLRYTFESWRVGSAALKERFPNKRIVGWYHTHLVDGWSPHLGKERPNELSKLFFSQSDIFLHKQFFPDEWYVAMVLDTEGQSIFFQWLNKEIVPSPGYCIFDDNPAPPVEATA